MVKVLLIIDATKDYLSLFKNIKTVTIINEFGDEVKEELMVDQAGWEDVNLSAYSDSGVVVDIKPSRRPIYASKQFDYRTIKPNFVVIRDIPYGLPNGDFRNLVYGLHYAGIPTLNTTESIIWHFERPVMYASLLSIQKRLGHDKFPLIPQTYYPNYQEMRFTPSFPLVVKVGHVHAGFGKMLLTRQDDFTDLSSILALHRDYATAESYISGEYDIRIQKIGNHYRAYKRMSAGWKGNQSSAILEDVPMTEQFKLWIDECAKLYGGMDVLAVDAIHSADDGKDYILEMNDTSIGFAPQHEEEDMAILRDLALRRMSEALSKKGNLAVAARATPTTPKKSLGKSAFLYNDNIGGDSTSLYKRLEVELINTENSKMELEKELKISQTKLNYLSLKMKDNSKASSVLSLAYTCMGFAAGMAVGTVAAVAIFKMRESK